MSNSQNPYGQSVTTVSFLDPSTKQSASQVARKNLKKEATMVVADARRDITIPFFSDVFQPTDDTLIKRGGGKGLALYDEIERDTFAFAVLQKRKKTLVAREWEVTPGGEDQIDLDAAEFVEAQFKALPFDAICEDLLDATLKGYSVSEVVWKRDGNHIVPAQVIGHEQRRFVFDMDWKPRLLTLANQSKGEELPDRKFITHRFGVKGNNPYGLGMGTRLFWPVLFKREGVAFWMTFLDKFAAPTVIGKTPFGLDSAMERQLLDSLASIVQNSAVTVPMGTEITLLEAARTGSVSYEDWCKFWNNEISIGTLGESLTTSIGDVGSKAAAAVHEDILQMLVDADGDLLSATLRTTIIQWLVDYNFPGAKLPNVWRIRPDNEKATAETREAKGSAAIVVNDALKQVVATSARFADDADAKEYIIAMAPETLDHDMVERLVKQRFEFAKTATEVVKEQPRATLDPITGVPIVEPKKKDLTPKPGQTSFAENDIDADADIQATLVDRLGAFGDDWDRQRLVELEAVLGASDSLEDAAKRALKLLATWKADTFANTIRLAMAASAYAGRDAVLGEMIGEVSFADASVFSQPFQEQIDFFSQKTPRPTSKWTDIMKGDHDRAFMIAGAKDHAMLADFQASIAQAMKDGTTLETFRKDFDQIVAKHGWTYKSERGWRTKVIFETNVRTSYMAGRLKQMRDPAVLKARPFWQYRHGQTRLPKIPRAEHLAWNGLILPADDPFWDKHFPPNGWLCSCGVRTLSARDLGRLGKSGPDDSPSTLMKPQIDTKTGKLVERPAGIDHGFDYQPGDLWERGLVPTQIDRLFTKSAFTVDQAIPIADLVAASKPFKAKKLKAGKPAEDYVDAFLKPFGAKRGKAVLHKDQTGESVLVSDQLFRDADGTFKVMGSGQDVRAAQLAEAIRDPDEIWIGVAEAKIPTAQGGGTELVIDRKFIRTDPKTGLLAVFELLKGTWSAKTAIRPTNAASITSDAVSIDKMRTGVLVYKRD